MAGNVIRDKFLHGRQSYVHSYTAHKFAVIIIDRLGTGNHIKITGLIIVHIRPHNVICFLRKSIVILGKVIVVSVTVIKCWYDPVAIPVHIGSHIFLRLVICIRLIPEPSPKYKLIILDNGLQNMKEIIG